jgi:hypothetical protein
MAPERIVNQVLHNLHGMYTTSTLLEETHSIFLNVLKNICSILMKKNRNLGISVFGQGGKLL